MDSTIPIVTGTPLYPPPVAPHHGSTASTTYDAYGNATTTATTSSSTTTSRPDLRTSTALNGGRSSRVVLPNAGQSDLLFSSQTVRSLQDQGFTAGLAQALQANKRAFPLSIWIVDNSGSMAARDGHRFVETTRSDKVRIVDCTRWSEMQQTVAYHVQMAALLQSPTVFRLLNDPGRVAGPQQFSIAETTHATDASRIAQDVATATATMNAATPGGVTPLIPHLQEVRQNILDLEDQLRKDGSKVVLVLATDGLPTDERGISDSAVQQRFIDTLRSLEGLPVWIVVRLCTDEDAVVDFWNNLDSQLELSLEVLDDFIAEAKEIQATNPWLNYGLPLHRMREMGFYSKLFDLLDERALAKDELTEFFRLLFGPIDGVPDPLADWSAFCDAVERQNRIAGKTWNPISRRMEYWVDIRKLKRTYKRGWFW